MKLFSLNHAAFASTDGVDYFDYNNGQTQRNKVLPAEKPAATLDWVEFVAEKSIDVQRHEEDAADEFLREYLSASNDSSNSHPALSQLTAA